MTSWTLSWVGVVLALVLVGGYVPAWRSARRREIAGLGWPRLAWFLTGVLVLLLVTCGPVGALSSTILWVFALRAAVLTAVVPLVLALGRPIEVLAASRPGGLRTPSSVRAVARVLMFPAVSSVLSAVSLVAVFWTGYGQAAVTHGLVDAVLVVHLLLVGSLVTLPLLGEGLLPEWATPGMRTLIAFLDGLVDALPGIFLMTSSTLLMPRFPGFVGHHAHRGDLSPTFDQRLAGGALLAVAEAVGVPMLIAVFADWVRSDAKEAEEADRRLDEQDEAQLSEPWWLREGR